jgi:hypothetical protein
MASPDRKSRKTEVTTVAKAREERRKRQIKEAADRVMRKRIAAKKKREAAKK